VNYSKSFEEIIGRGQQTFHQVYLSLRKRNGLEKNDLEFLDVCIIVNLFILFALGYYLEDKEFIHRKVSTSNRVIINLIENKPINCGIPHNSELIKILKDAINCAQKCIEEGNVGYIVNILSLVRKIPSYSMEQINELKSLIDEWKRYLKYENKLNKERRNIDGKIRRIKEEYDKITINISKERERLMKISPSYHVF